MFIGSMVAGYTSSLVSLVAAFDQEGLIVIKEMLKS